MSGSSLRASETWSLWVPGGVSTSRVTGGPKSPQSRSQSCALWEDYFGFWFFSPHLCVWYRPDATKVQNKGCGSRTDFHKREKNRKTPSKLYLELLNFPFLARDKPEVNFTIKIQFPCWGGSGPMSWKNHSWTQESLFDKSQIYWWFPEDSRSCSPYGSQLWGEIFGTQSSNPSLPLSRVGRCKQTSASSWLDLLFQARFCPCFDSKQAFPHHENLSEVFALILHGDENKMWKFLPDQAVILCLAVMKSTGTVRGAQQRSRWKAQGRCRDSDPAWCSCTFAVLHWSQILNIWKLFCALFALMAI